jgi:hypothetical protein
LHNQKVLKWAGDFVIIKAILHRKASRYTSVGSASNIAEGARAKNDFAGGIEIPPLTNC